MTKTAIQWAFVIFKLLAGAGAGILGYVGLVELAGTRAEANRKAIIIGIALLIAGGLAALLQVGKPEGVTRVFANISLASPVSWELLSYGIAVIVSIVYLLFLKSSKVLLKIVAFAAIVVAVVVGFTTGYSHMSMPGMPSWHNPAIPACFLLSALLTGGLGYLAIDKKAEDEKGFKLITTLVIALAVLSTIGYVAYGLTAKLGDFQMVYWAVAPVAGGIVCIASTLLLRIRASAAWLYSALTTALIGAVAFRAIIWAIVETGLRTGSNPIHL